MARNRTNEKTPDVNSVVAATDTPGVDPTTNQEAGSNMTNSISTHRQMPSSKSTRRPAMSVEAYRAEQNRLRAADQRIAEAQAVRARLDAAAAEEKSADVGVVTDVDGNEFEVGFHRFPNLDTGSVDRFVTVGEHGTPIPVEQIPELIRLLTVAARSADGAGELVFA